MLRFLFGASVSIFLLDLGMTVAGNPNHIVSSTAVVSCGLLLALGVYQLVKKTVDDRTEELERRLHTVESRIDRYSTRWYADLKEKVDEMNSKENT